MHIFKLLCANIRVSEREYILMWWKILLHIVVHNANDVGRASEYSGSKMPVTYFENSKFQNTKN